MRGSETGGPQHPKETACLDSSLCNADESTLLHPWPFTSGRAARLISKVAPKNNSICTQIIIARNNQVCHTPSVSIT